MAGGQSVVQFAGRELESRAVDKEIYAHVGSEADGDFCDWPLGVDDLRLFDGWLESDTERAVLHNDSTAAIVDFQQRDEGIRDFCRERMGMSCFRRSGAAGFWRAGLMGAGRFMCGEARGYATITEATVGCN